MSPSSAAPVPPGPARTGVRVAVRLAGATKTFPARSGTAATTAVRALDLDVAPGEFVALVGPTGCGKSTVLSLIAGLEAPTAGRVEVGGSPVRGIPPGVGFMFQRDAILPWRSAVGNVALAPRYRGHDAASARALAREWVARVGLGGFENHYPHQLSGGMRKRVALAQTLVAQPQILLMDEPFGALDAQTRQLMQDELLRVWSGSGAAVVFVTHDLDEAVALADRVVVLSAAPASVLASFPVDLPRPRAVERVRLTEEFARIRRPVWEALHDEVAAARSRAVAGGDGRVA